MGACPLARFVALLPLAYMDFRLPFSEVVTASDASTSGGGFAVSSAGMDWRQNEREFVVKFLKNMILSGCWQ